MTMTLSRSFLCLMCASVASLSWSSAHAQNQTVELSELIEGQTPFRVTIEKVDWKSDPLATVHSAAVSFSGEKVIIVGGMSAGMHDFSCDAGQNFPSSIFNHTLYMIDVDDETSDARVMDVASTGMTPDQIAAMASINTLYEEIDDTLLIVGGYGIDSNGDYVTFDTLRVIDVPGTIGWISGDGTLLSEHVTFLDPPKNTPAALADDFFTITGGIMLKNNDELWLCLGQSFQGGYVEESACPVSYDQVYTRSIRRFRLDVDNPEATLEYLGATTERPEWARRRDLNIFPARVPGGGVGGVALSGVFTDYEGGFPGIWTVPIVINSDGTMTMDDPSEPGALRQGFNAYNSGRLTLWSEARQENWFVSFGGLGYQVLYNGELRPDPTIPYSNGVLAVRYQPETNEWSQHLLDAAYPEIYTDQGLLYYHGTEALTIPRVETSAEGLFDLDSITEPTTVAWIYGGILAAGQAVLESVDTYASNYLFRVVIEPVDTCPGDLDDNGIVNGADLGILLAHWGKVTSKQSAADFDENGIVDGADLQILLADWGPCS